MPAEADMHERVHMFSLRDPWKEQALGMEMTRAGVLALLLVDRPPYLFGKGILSTLLPDLKVK